MEKTLDFITNAVTIQICSSYVFIIFINHPLTCFFNIKRWTFTGTICDIAKAVTKPFPNA